MSNGATYYPQGFEHRADSGYGSNSNYTSKNANDARMLRAGWVRNPFKDKGYHANVEWLRPETAEKWQKEYDELVSSVGKEVKKREAIRNVKNTVNGAVDTVKNAPGNAVGAVKKAVTNEANAMKLGYNAGVHRYDREHGEKGNAVGRAIAGATRAARYSTPGQAVARAYNVGKAAVTNAGRMLATGAGKIKEGAVAAFDNIKGAVGKAAGNVADFAKSAAGRVAKDFKDVARAIGNTALGEAARRAGEAALKAGGSVVGAVGGALEGIVKFFGGAIDSAKTAVRVAKNRRKNGTTYDSAIGPQPDLAGPQEQYGPWQKKK
jgi:hypothetical protein